MAVDLNELADRVEALAGPDREVDDAIATAIYSEPERHCIKGLSDEAGGMWMFHYPNGSIGSSLRFTGSIDAAMTLAPDRWTYIEFLRFDDSTVECSLEAIGCKSGFAGAGRSRPIALTAAALRARAGGRS